MIAVMEAIYVVQVRSFTAAAILPARISLREYGKGASSSDDESMCKIEVPVFNTFTRK